MDAVDLGLIQEIVKVVVTAAGALAFVALLYVAGMFAAVRVRLKRHMVHDANGVLGMLRIAAYRGDERKVELGFDMLQAIISPDCEVVIKLRRLVKSVVDLLETPPGCEAHGYYHSEIAVRVVPREVISILQNLLLNAAEGACGVPRDQRQPILVELTDEQLLIRNVASARSLAALVAGPGNSTKPTPRHGIGRLSAARAADALGWSIRWEVDGMYALVTVTGFVPAVDAGEP